MPQDHLRLLPNAETNGLHSALYAKNPNPHGYAGYFQGHVRVNSSQDVTGSKSFKIDHPLDPANKYLTHSAVESADMKNIYDGVALLDANGEAVVELPEWFESINIDFRYQLTPIGAPGPNLHIAEEITDNQFKIGGGASEMKVSWQVAGTRHDKWAAANPIQVEEEKPAEERGYYLQPELYGESREKGHRWARNPELMRQMEERTQQREEPRRRMEGGEEEELPEAT